MDWETLLVLLLLYHIIIEKVSKVCFLCPEGDIKGEGADDRCTLMVDYPVLGQPILSTTKWFYSLQLYPKEDDVEGLFALQNQGDWAENTL